MKRPFRPYEGTEPYIYVSYSHKDREIVLPVLDAMDRRGYRIWYDDGIPAGSSWMATIAERILNCAAGIVFLSSSAARSMHFQAEAMELLHRDKTVIPVRMEAEIDLPPGLSMALGQSQSMDLYEDEPLDDILTEMDCSETLSSCRTREETG